MGKQNYFFSGITDILILAILCEHDSYVYEIVKFIKENEIDTSIYSLPFIKPLNKSQLIEIASKYKKIIIMEEHQKSGGVGSAILEQLCDIQYEGLIKYIPTIQRIAIDDKFYSLSGSQQYLRNIAGLTLKKSYFHI